MNQLSERQRYQISGLRCSGCAVKLTRKLDEIDGLAANVSFSLGVIEVNQPQSAQLELLIDIVEGSGYQLATEQTSFQVQGWSCTNCANKTQSKLMAIPGVKNVQVNVTAQQLQVTYLVGAVSQSDLGVAVASLGYTITLEKQRDESLESNQERQYQRENRTQLRHLTVAVFATIPLMMPMAAMIFGLALILNPWLEFGLATVVQFYIGRRYYRGAWHSLKSRSANMDTLVALGTSAAYFYSCYLLFSDWQTTHGKLYFEASTVIITFVSIGKWQEHRAKRQTGSAIRQLLALKPLTANVIRGVDILSIPVSQLLLGDQVQVRAGESIGVDGKVIAGASEVDESLLTGESMPVTKGVGDQVIAGSVNGHGILTIEVTALGDETSLSHIIKLVEQAQMTKAPIEKLVDRVSSIFVPTILLIALLTFVVWYALGAGFEMALINSVAVLVVACPCALGLATPAAITVGSGVAALHGIIIRDPAALQIASKIDRVAFDKTGTLTEGQPKVVKFTVIEGSDDIDVLLGSLMRQSEHPLARSIVEYCLANNELGVAVDQPTVIAGKGITATYQGRRLSAGNSDLMAELGVSYQNVENGSNDSQVFFAIDNTLIALVELRDKSREHSGQAIARLKHKGLKTAMLSGDREAAANTIANELGIEQVFANLKPQQKLEQLKIWQQDEVVAMVGDGINDAPALAQADLGIAMGTGTQIAISSAQITLMQGDPNLVVDAIDIAHATWTKIKQNLFLAFVFNALAIPLAAMGYLTPQLAGAAMALSSITVLSNALLLKNWSK